MNYGPLLFFGVFLTLTSSFWGLVVAPQLQLGRQMPVAQENVGQFYPAPRSGLAQEGAQVYRTLGCVECHTEQVRGLGSDLARVWGERISVAQDYLYDDPVQLGQQRLGPDLTNIGVRQTNAVWHFLHLFDPKLTVVGSPMPRYPFLFDREPEGTQFPSPWALTPELEQNGRKFHLVPKREARALVAYLLSLRSEVSLFEAPGPKPETNAPPAGSTSTNQTSTPAAVKTGSAPAP